MLYESTRARGDPAVPDVSTNLAYAGHFLIYAALAFLVQTAAHTHRAAVVLLVAAAVALYGGALEAYQSTLAGRQASVYDGLANLLGALTGAFLASRLLPRWEAILERGGRQASGNRQQDS